MKKNIDTDRLSLEPLTADDSDFILKILNTPGWLRFIGDRHVRSTEDAAAYIQKINSTANIIYWVAKNRDDEAPMGIISFIKRAYLEHFDIGFAFLPEFIGKGFAREAAKAVLKKAAVYPEHNCVLATTMPENTASIRLLAGLDFHFSHEITVENEILHVYSNCKNS